MTTRKPLTVRDAIRFLTLLDDGLSNAQIQQRLEWLGLPPCTLFLISQTRACLRDDMRFLERAGLLRDKRALIPARIRRLKPPKPDPGTGFLLPVRQTGLLGGCV